MFSIFWQPYSLARVAAHFEGEVAARASGTPAAGVAQLAPGE
jgi:hypothetical protein